LDWFGAVFSMNYRIVNQYTSFSTSLFLSNMRKKKGQCGQPRQYDLPHFTLSDRMVAFEGTFSSFFFDELPSTRAINLNDLARNLSQLSNNLPYCSGGLGRENMSSIVLTSMVSFPFYLTSLIGAYLLSI
jgi:hypothetical protein